MQQSVLTHSSNRQCYSAHVRVWEHCTHVGICVFPSVNTSLHPLLSCQQESEYTYGVVTAVLLKHTGQVLRLHA